MSFDFGAIGDLLNGLTVQRPERGSGLRVAIMLVLVASVLVLAVILAPPHHSAFSERQNTTKAIQP